MTIALGFHASDGVVLCADMQKTIGEMKTYDGKVGLDIFHNVGAVMSVAGAGHEDYIQTAKSYLVDVFSKQQTWPAVKENLREALLCFFRTHIGPWASFRAENHPSVELLIGITGEEIPPTLFHYQGTAFSEVRIKPIGLGILLAQDLLDRYSHRAILTASQCATLGTYILDKVKQGVEGCGGPTHIVALRKGMDFALTRKQDIEAIEKHFSEAEAVENARFIEDVKKMPLSLSWHSEHKKPA